MKKDKTAKDNTPLEGDTQKKNAPFSSDKQIVSVGLNNTKVILGKVTQDVFIHRILAQQLPWKDIVSSHSVSKTWYDACKELCRPYDSVELCWKRAKEFTWRSLWTYLLGSEKIMTDDLTFVDDYFGDIGLPAKRNTILSLDKTYRNEPGSLFHPNYSILDRIVRRHPHLSFMEGIPQTQKKALGHIQALLSNWRKEQPPNTLLVTLKQLMKTAQTLRKNAPEVVQWILTSESQYELPQRFNEKIKAAYSKLFVFLNETAKFERTLLEFMVFDMLVKNRQNTWKGHEQNRLIFQLDFPLSNRLSKYFYQYYLNYLNCMANAKKNHTPVLIKADLFEYLCHDDDKFLLRLLEPMWGKLPNILSTNPKLYERMTPDLWIQLCKKSNSSKLHVINILKNPTIYKKFESVQLFNFLEKYSFYFKLLLYGGPISEMPVEGMPFSELKDKNVQLAKEILAQLELNHLIRLCEKKFKNADSVVKIIYLMIFEKFNMNLKQSLKQVDVNLLLKFLKNISKEKSTYILEENDQLFQRLEEDCINTILSDATIYCRFETKQILEIIKKYTTDFLKKENIGIEGGILSRLQLDQLICLCEETFISEKDHSVQDIIYRMISEKLKTSETETLKQLSDDFLLKFLKNASKKAILDILETNAHVCERMRPELWIKLCEKNGRSDCLDIVLSHPTKIYEKFGSETAFQFLKNHADTFFQKEAHIEIEDGMLSRLELDDLIRLRNEQTSLKKSIDLFIVKYHLTKKLEKNLLGFFKKYPETIPDILRLNNELWEHIQPEGWLDLCKVNKNITDAWSQPRSYLGFVLTNEKIYKKFNIEQLIELMSSLRNSFSLQSISKNYEDFYDNFKVKLKDKLKGKLKNTLENLGDFTANQLIDLMSELRDFCRLTIDQNNLIYQALMKKLEVEQELKKLYSRFFTDNKKFEDSKIADSLKEHRPWVLTTVKQAYNHRFRPFVFYSSRIKEKWLAIPFGWQVGFCAFLALTGAAMVSAGVVSLVLCPPLLVVLPILGKMALPLLVGATAGILDGIAGILHLIHVAITPAPRPVPSSCTSTGSERHIKTQAGRSTRTVSKKNTKVKRTKEWNPSEKPPQKKDEYSRSDIGGGRRNDIFSKGQRYMDSSSLKESDDSGDEYRDTWVMKKD